MRQRKELKTPPGVIAWRAMSMLCVAGLLIAGVVGGLLRAGVGVPLPEHSAWPGQAVVAHAFLMICGVMGTVIGIERAVAVKRRLALVAPVLSACAGFVMLSGGGTPAAAWLSVAAAIAFVLVNVVVIDRQLAAHTVLLLVGAVAWLVGDVLFALGSPLATALAIPWWFAFLVFTIAAERLEMTRLMRRRPGASASLYATLAAMLVGAAAFALSPAWGGIVYGLSLVALSAWLITFDIARRTVAAHGLSRYMAVCLLAGYAWLAVAGVAWVGNAFGWPVRDVALHALGLGFVFSMMLGHAPVILPALARIKIEFGWFFYVPLAVLHASLAVRLGLGARDFAMLSMGAQGNAIAIALFAATLAGAAITWRIRTAPSRDTCATHKLRAVARSLHKPRV
jgi:hypothetical protein